MKLNKLIRKVKECRCTKLHFQSVPLNQMCWVMCQDAGWGNCPDDHSQRGNVLMMAEQEITTGKIAKVSFVE